MVVDQTIGGGLATEGYVGGYMDAINDVILALNNVKPTDRYGFWRDFVEKPESR